jgi:hypothetical protein
MWRSPGDAHGPALFGQPKRHITFGSEAAKELHDTRVRAPHLLLEQSRGLAVDISFGGPLCLRRRAQPFWKTRLLPRTTTIQRRIPIL